MMATKMDYKCCMAAKIASRTGGGHSVRKSALLYELRFAFSSIRLSYFDFTIVQTVNDSQRFNAYACVA